MRFDGRTASSARGDPRPGEGDDAVPSDRPRRHPADAADGGAAMNRRVVVTGMGAVTPLGNDAPSTWQGLTEGRSGVGPLTSIDTTGFEVTIAGEVKDFQLSDVVPRSVGLRHLLRPGTFGVGAAWEALRDAGVDEKTYDGADVGVAMGACVDRPDLQWLVDVGALRDKTGRDDAFTPYAPSDALAYSQNIAAAAMARMLDATGPMLGLSTACSSPGTPSERPSAPSRRVTRRSCSRAATTP